MSKLAQRRAARKGYQKAAAATKPGEGSRFKALAKSAKASGATNPEAVAASVMWKKYGKKGGAALIKKGKAGRKRAAGDAPLNLGSFIEKRSRL